MNEEHDVIDYQLDSISRTVRFAVGSVPRTATRVSLGVALAIDDAAHDEAAELLSAKVAQGVTAFSSALGTITRSAGDKAVGLASSVKSAARIPALKATNGLVGQAVSEAREAWKSAGYVPVVITPDAPVSPSETEVSS